MTNPQNTNRKSNETIKVEDYDYKPIRFNQTMQSVEK